MNRKPHIYLEVNPKTARLLWRVSVAPHLPDGRSSMSSEEDFAWHEAWGWAFRQNLRRLTWTEAARRGWRKP